MGTVFLPILQKRKQRPRKNLIPFLGSWVVSVGGAVAQACPLVDGGPPPLIGTHLGTCECLDLNVAFLSVGLSISIELTRSHIAVVSTLENSAFKTCLLPGHGWLMNGI